MFRRIAVWAEALLDRAVHGSMVRADRREQELTRKSRDELIAHGLPPDVVERALSLQADGVWIDLMGCDDGGPHVQLRQVPAEAWAMLRAEAWREIGNSFVWPDGKSCGKTWFWCQAYQSNHH